jgi:hypothetical protein
MKQKENPQRIKEILTWIEKVIQEPLESTDSLHVALKSGVTLVRFVGFNYFFFVILLAAVNV